MYSDIGRMNTKYFFLPSLYLSFRIIFRCSAIWRVMLSKWRLYFAWHLCAYANRKYVKKKLSSLESSIILVLSGLKKISHFFYHSFNLFKSWSISWKKCYKHTVIILIKGFSQCHNYEYLTVKIQKLIHVLPKVA